MTTNDFIAPFNLADMGMLTYGDLEDFPLLDFNEADFADLDASAWQNLNLDQNGLTGDNDYQANAVNGFPADISVADAAFIAEVMAGVEQAPSFGSLQVEVDHDLRPPGQPGFSRGQPVEEGPNAPVAYPSLKPHAWEQLEMPVGGKDALVDADNGLHTPPDGYVAPPGTPVVVGEVAPGTQLETIVEQVPAAPASSPNPSEEQVAAQRNEKISIAATQAQTAHPASQARNGEAPIEVSTPAQYHLLTSYQGRFHHFDAARQALTGAGANEILVKLPLTTEDDWQVVKERQVHGLAAQLYNAIQAQPGEPPQNFTPFQRDYYYEHQSRVLISIKETIAAKPAEAEARILLIFEEVINLHEHGLPAADLRRKGGPTSSFVVETSLICSTRAGRIIEMAKTDKYVAHDMLTGTNIKDITRSPIKYLERKRGNSRVNAKKAENHRLAALGEVVPITTRGRKTAASRAAMGRQAPPAASDASRSATWAPTPVPRAAPVVRIKATLKRKVDGESGLAATKRAKHGGGGDDGGGGDGDEEMVDV